MKRAPISLTRVTTLGCVLFGICCAPQASRSGPLQGEDATTGQSREIRGDTCPEAPRGISPALVLYTPQGQIPLPDSTAANGLGATKSWFRKGQAINFRGEEYYIWSERLTSVPTEDRLPNIKVVYCGEYDGVPIYTHSPQSPYFITYIYIQLTRSGVFQQYAAKSEVQVLDTMLWD